MVLVSLMLKRWLITLGVAWLLGCAVTVLVAWCCAVEGANLGEWEAIDNPKWPAPPLEGWPAQPQYGKLWINNASLHGFEFSTTDASSPSGFKTYDMYFTRFGWPLASMYSIRYEGIVYSSLDTRVETIIDGPGIEILPYRTGSSATDHPYHLKLPITPLWQGFLANSAIAAALFLTFALLLRVGTARHSRHAPRRPGRVHVRWIALSLLLGVLASVAVALGQWAYSEFETAHFLNLDGASYYSPLSGSDAGETPLQWPGTPPPGWPVRSTHLTRFRVEWGVRFHAYNQGWIASDPSDPDFDPYSAIVTQAGWPVPCLEAIDFVETRRDGSWTRTTSSLVVPVATRPESASSSYAEAPVPLNPIWLGLVANTLLYGYLITLPLLTVRAVRVVRRRCRGACECCGYSRLGLAPDVLCPECGARSVSRADHATPPESP